MRVADLQDERYALISDSQRVLVLQDLGMEDELPEWPHLLVRTEDGELLEVWGCRFSPPLPEEPVVPLFPRQKDYPDEPDWLEAREWEDLEGPELPGEW